MIINGLELLQNKSEEDIIKKADIQNELDKTKESQNILLQLINEIIIGTFSSYEGINLDYSLINTRYFQFKQYYTYNQNRGSLCGFHSLFNIYYFLQYLTTEERNKKNLALFNLKNAWSFWSFYKESINYLLTNLKLASSDENSLRKEGPLERYQFIYLLNNYPKMTNLFDLLKINYDILITKFLYGFGIFNGTVEEGIDFQKKVDSFLEDNNSNKGKILIILLGIVNHWNVLIFHKNVNNEMSIYLLDSRNSPEIFESIDLYDNINNSSDNKIKLEKIKEQYINNILNKKIGNKKETDWFITCRKEWYDSMNKSLILIFKVFLKKLNLYNYIIDNKISSLINSFLSKTNIDLIDIKLNDKNNININNGEILKWIKEEYHPAVFNDELLLDIKKVNYIIKDMKFISWTKGMILYLNGLKDNKTLNEIDKEIVLRYLNHLGELEKYFNTQ